MNVLDLIAKNHNEWVEVCKVFGVTDYPEDIVQEMYIKISKSKITTDLNYKGYVYAALRNLCYDRHKGQQYHLPIDNNRTEDNFKSDDHLHWLDIQKALHELPYFERKVIELHKIEGFSLCEIEKETSICRVKMMRAKNKGIERLKLKLNK
jgi:RNA polymerase sigma factor (sigma-70 family)